MVSGRRTCVALTRTASRFSAGLFDDIRKSAGRNAGAKTSNDGRGCPP